MVVATGIGWSGHGQSSTQLWQSRATILLIAAMSLTASCAPAVDSKSPVVAPAVTERPEAPAASSSTAVALPSSQTKAWWCHTSPGTMEVGVCAPTALACAAAVARLATADEAAQCQQQDIAICMDVKDARTGAVELFCHPTFATCRSHIDILRRTSSADWHIASGCVALTRAGTLAPRSEDLDEDEAAHWWCLSSGTISSCARSRSRCGRDRQQLIVRRHPGALDSICVPHSIAYCFDYRRRGDASLHCVETSAACERLSRRFNNLLSSCRATD